MNYRQIRSAWGAFAAPALLVLALVSASNAQDEQVVWGNPTAVDTGVLTLPGSTGASAQWFSDRLWVFYEKSGDIYGVSHDTHGWTAPRRFTTDPARQSNPHVLGYQVIWEDARGAVPEIWTAHFDGGDWTGEMMLSPNDGIASRNGAFGPDMAAWEDSSANGFRVYVRRFDGTNWLAQEPVTSDATGQRDPSLSGAWTHDIVWADYRHGAPEIYKRPWYPWNGAWGPESRLTDMPGACRRPSLKIQPYGDVYEEDLVAFEHVEVSGVAETYRWLSGGSVRLSPDDGIPSVRPNNAGFTYGVRDCGGMPYSSPVHYVTWTDLDPGGTRSHYVWGRSGIDETPGSGIATSIIAARGGEPRADLVEAWIERIGIVPTLMARLGTTTGCLNVEISANPSLLLGPEGVPENVIQALNSCDGGPLEGTSIQVSFDDSFTQHFTWDPAHLPQHGYELTTDENGEASFSLYGGGCSQEGPASIQCGYWPFGETLGGKSPDVNGDCWVKPDDLAYVQSKMGTADFCADLDMSGMVGPEDEAIVQMTLWDHCSSVTGVDEAMDQREPALFAAPNPARGSVQLHLARSGAEAVRIALFDTAGRLVRTLNVGASERLVSWDLRNNAGETVAGGLYFAVAHVAGARLVRPVLILR